MHAYCFASGHIEFGRKLPDGALPIARGNAKPLRDLIEGTARHGYKSKTVKGRLTKIPGTDCLLVPGVPEAPDQSSKYEAFQRYARWIKGHAKSGVTVILGGP